MTNLICLALFFVIQLVVVLGLQEPQFQTLELQQKVALMRQVSLKVVEQEELQVVSPPSVEVLLQEQAFSGPLEVSGREPLSLQPAV